LNVLAKGGRVYPPKPLYVSGLLDLRGPLSETHGIFNRNSLGEPSADGAGDYVMRPLGVPSLPEKRFFVWQRAYEIGRTRSVSTGRISQTRHMTSHIGHREVKRAQCGIRVSRRAPSARIAAEDHRGPFR
jgi:hypothetical protein